MATKACPPLSKELLDYLQATFPNKLPTYVPPSDFMGSLIGQQQVIGHLAAKFKEQNS